LQNWIYFTATGYHSNYDPYYKFLFRCRLDGTNLECVTNENANHTIQFSPNRNCFLDTYSTIDSAPVTLLKSLNGNIIASIEIADLKGLTELNWVPPKRFKVKARDGITYIYGNLYFPSHFDPKNKYPLIDHIYPGPQVYRTTINFSLHGLIFRSPWTAQALAELGFIVMHIDGFGTPGRSKSFHDATYQNMGDCGIPDHVIAIKQLASQHEFINVEKVGITGFSGGGYAAARAMLLYPELYKVGVSAAGNHDLRCYPASYGEKYNSLDINTYEYQSNAALAKNLKGKLLLIHGEMDDNVHPCATYQFVNALIEHNKNFDLLIMPNLNHRATFDHPYYVRRQWDYLIQNLLEIIPPYNETHILSEIPETFPQLIDW
jgi:dipeptidyl-peptidase-4